MEKICIMVVEDELIVAMGLQHTLETLSYEQYLRHSGSGERRIL